MKRKAEIDRAGGYIGEALGEGFVPRPTTGTREYTRGCRHIRAWAICGASSMWCPDCGAIRAMRPTDHDPNHSEFAWSGWIKPDGQELALRRYEAVTKGGAR